MIEQAETGEVARHGETIRLEVDARGVATLTLNRPTRHNALDATMIAELTEAAAWLAAAKGPRAVVLAAEGESFCAGADLRWMRAQMAASRATRLAEAGRLAQMLGAWDRLPLPLIARIQGQAYGGGLGLVAVADVALAATGVPFALTETRLGLIPATIAPYVVARMGPAARGVLYSGRRFDADEALALGLVTRVVPAEALDAAVEAELTPYFSTAPGAVAAAKALFHALGSGVDQAAIEASVAALADRWETEEAAEGIAAFFEKRRPGWQPGD